jgi:neopullulanase
MFQPYLPDIDWNQKGAEKQFVADAVNWIAAFDLDGFRVDAVKHVESNSVYNLRAALGRRFEQGGARIFMVGETAVGEFDRGTFFGESFGSGFEWIDAYTGPTALDGQFDFPTRHNMADGLVNGDKPLNEVESELRKAETRYRPGSRHVRFLNGHDNPRIASIAAKDPKLGCLWSSGCRDDQLPPLAYADPTVYEKLKRALTVLYTMPGIPYLYMGDEVAFGGGADPDMRRNMLFGEGLEALEMTKPGAAHGALTSRQGDLRDWVRRLGSTRSQSFALRRGERKTLVGNDPNLWVYAYEAGGQAAVVVVNRGAQAASRTVAAPGLGGRDWRSALGTGSATATDGDGLELRVGPGEAAIFVAQ